MKKSKFKSILEVAGIISQGIVCGELLFPYLDIRYFVHLVIQVYSKLYAPYARKYHEPMKNDTNTHPSIYEILNMIDMYFNDQMVVKTVYDEDMIRVTHADDICEDDNRILLKGDKMAIHNIVIYDTDMLLYDLGVPGTSDFINFDTDTESECMITFDEFFECVKSCILDLVATVEPTSVNAPYFYGWHRRLNEPHDYSFKYVDSDNITGYTPFDIKDDPTEMYVKPTNNDVGKTPYDN